MKKAVVNNKKIDTKNIKKLIVEGDVIDSISFIVPRYYNGIDLSLYTMYLKYKNDEGEGEDLVLTTTVGVDKLTCVWIVGGTFTQDEGQHEIQLWCGSVVNNETVLKWQSFPAYVEVIYSVAPTPIVPTTPSAIEVYLSQMSTLKTQAQTAATTATTKATVTTTKAGEAENSAISAATSETNAATSAAIAANKSTISATKATESANSATAAETAKNDAETARFQCQSIVAGNEAYTKAESNERYASSAQGEKADTALQSFTETDPTVPSWAKSVTKPTYSKSEIGLSDVENILQYSPNNPPPYPVTSVNGQTGEVIIPISSSVESVNNKTGAVTITKSDVGLGNVDNTADANKSVANSDKLGGSLPSAFAPAPTVLYNNTTGGTNANLTLSATVANYTYVKIYFTYDTGVVLSSIEVKNPNNKGVSISILEGDVNSMYYKFAQIYINGTSVTFNSNGHGWIPNGGTNNINATSKPIRILSIEAWN